MEAAEAILRAIAAAAALFVEGMAVLVILVGAVQSLVRLVERIALGRTPGWRRELFVGFGRWLILGLEFALAADIVRTIISPSWNDIGQLAAIALIRTFLNYFLEKDLGEAGIGLAPPPRAT
jgi:uncharacterized membrane protein